MKWAIGAAAIAGVALADSSNSKYFSLMIPNNSGDSA